MVVAREGGRRREVDPEALSLEGIGRQGQPPAGKSPVDSCPVDVHAVDIGGGKTVEKLLAVVASPAQRRQPEAVHTRQASPTDPEESRVRTDLDEHVGAVT